MNWNQEQYQKLAEHYRDLPEEHLLALAAAPEELTEIAEEVLAKELASRNLGPVTPPEVSPQAVSLFLDDERAEAWQSYAAQAPAHCTFSYDVPVEAYRAQNFLAESGVFSRVIESSNEKSDLRSTRVVILPEDAEKAAAILSQPIPEHIVAHVETRENEDDVPDFAAPTCPACQTSDPVLIAVDPTNRWLCEACEHEWDDPFEEGSSEESSGA